MYIFEIASKNYFTEEWEGGGGKELGKRQVGLPRPHLSFGSLPYQCFYSDIIYSVCLLPEAHVVHAIALKINFCLLLNNCIFLLCTPHFTSKMWKNGLKSLMPDFLSITSYICISFTNHYSSASALLICSITPKVVLQEAKLLCCIHTTLTLPFRCIEQCLSRIINLRCIDFNSQYFPTSMLVYGCMNSGTVWTIHTAIYNH